eukprot:jgi/Tetstr1/456894/TSEL_043564.t1
MKPGLSRHPGKGQWEPVQHLEHLGMKFDSQNDRAQIMFLAIKPARFYLRELHDVLHTKDTMDRRSIYKLHITAYKELKDARYAVLAVLSKLRGRHVLLHKGNMAVLYILTNPTARSPLS